MNTICETATSRLLIFFLIRQYYIRASAMSYIFYTCRLDEEKITRFRNSLNTCLLIEIKNYWTQIISQEPPDVSYSTCWKLFNWNIIEMNFELGQLVTNALRSAQSIWFICEPLLMIHLWFLVSSDSLFIMSTLLSLNYFRVVGLFLSSRAFFINGGNFFLLLFFFTVSSISPLLFNAGLVSHYREKMFSSPLGRYLNPDPRMFNNAELNKSNCKGE